MIDQQNASQVLKDWKGAIENADMGRVVSLYHQDAVMVPTLSAKACQGKKEIGQYFLEFLKAADIEVSMDPPLIQEFEEIFIATGLYTVYWMEGDEKQEAKVRYSFALKEFKGKILIVHQHSSLNIGS